MSRFVASRLHGSRLDWILPTAFRVYLCVVLLFYGIGWFSPQFCVLADARPSRFDGGETIPTGMADPATSAKPYENGYGLDFFGNEVYDAVAEYTLDEDGSLYEIHSPQTDAVHLASPTT